MSEIFLQRTKSELRYNVTCTELCTFVRLVFWLVELRMWAWVKLPTTTSMWYVYWYSLILYDGPFMRLHRPDLHQPLNNSLPSGFKFVFCLPILWKLAVFNLLTSWTGSPGYTHSPSTVHRTRILSPNIASLAILTASVAILDSHRSLGHFSAHDNMLKLFWHNVRTLLKLIWHSSVMVWHTHFLYPLQILDSGKFINKICINNNARRVY